MARRLTKSQKLQIVEGFRDGNSTMTLAGNFCCSQNTIIRTIKSIISSEEYSQIKDLRNKESSTKKKREKFKDRNSSKAHMNDKSQVDSQHLDLIESHEDSSIIKKEDCSNFTKNQIDKNDFTVFEEVAPLIADFGFEEREQKVNCKNLSPGILPETVYILVDKKVELESISLNDLPDWDFLPEEEKNRRVIALFVNKREANRNCARSQRVIEIPDTNLFITVRSLLLNTGITRLVLEDKLISLET